MREMGGGCNHPSIVENKNFRCCHSIHFIRIRPHTYIRCVSIPTGMADNVKKSTGTKLMNAFPVIAFAIVFALTIVIWMELI